MTKRRSIPSPPPSRAASLLGACSRMVESYLDGIVPTGLEESRRLHRAMRYSLFAGGKRLRPTLALLTCRLVGGREKDALPAAAALEMIHTYSLIHDDLPAMDDDDFRRGKPSCHKAFDEATAILAGDALLTLAFETLAKSPPAIVPDLVKVIGDAAGARGMVGGQQADLEGEKGAPTPALVRFIHRRKTAALLRASVQAGAICGRADSGEYATLTEFGENLGLAFQIADDVLDVTAPSWQLGKTAGKDAKAGKATYPLVFGLDKSRREAARLAGRALRALEDFGKRGEELAEVMKFVIARTS
ncbi:MAG: geranylgeranyl diphosphate synthase type [Planctomycetota bacterium]|nr:MAG: geranylgeranyl diphosphate synthase type [Planctomycetota bacterium]